MQGPRVVHASSQYLVYFTIKHIKFVTSNVRQPLRQRTQPPHETTPGSCGTHNLCPDSRPEPEHGSSHACSAHWRGRARGDSMQPWGAVNTRRLIITGCLLLSSCHWSGYSLNTESVRRCTLPPANYNKLVIFGGKYNPLF